jgi:hypothetical protein
VGAFDAGVDDAVEPWVWTVRAIDFTEFDGPIDYVSCAVDILDVAASDGSVGAWSLTLRWDDPNRVLLQTPGYGVVIRKAGSSEVIASGDVSKNVTRISADGNGVDVGGALDEDVLKRDYAWTAPASAVTAGGNTDSNLFDTRTDDAETVLLGYIGDNIGSAALLPARRLAYLHVPASSGRGVVSTWQAAFTPLIDLARDLTAASGISVRVKQAAEDDRLEVVIRARADVSDDIVFSQLDGSIDNAEFEVDAPTATQAIGVTIDDATHTRTAYITTDAAAETKWGRRRVVIVDAEAGTQGTREDAAAAALVDGAEAFVASIAPVVLLGGPQPFVDYFLGDTVGVVRADGEVVEERLTLLSYEHEGGSDPKPPTITPGVGPVPLGKAEPVIGAVVKLTAIIRRQTKR